MRLLLKELFPTMKSPRIKEGFIMKLPDKIIKLRKANGWSQEDLAERLYVSRQAISRWENGTALPDSNNVLQLSKLFSVTADYLLNDDYSSDEDIPCVKEVHEIFDSKQKNFMKLTLVATIAFIIGAFVWLYQAINELNIVYDILAIVNAILSAVFLYIYEKAKRQK